jgi:trk system potassium uptake protein TrkH
MAALGIDLVSAGTAVITALGNVGPGLGAVGPVDNFAGVPAVGKLVLALCMLLGRLELFTVLALVIPSFWRK